AGRARRWPGARESSSWSDAFLSWMCWAGADTETAGPQPDAVGADEQGAPKGRGGAAEGCCRDPLAVEGGAEHGAAVAVERHRDVQSPTRVWHGDLVVAVGAVERRDVHLLR